MAQVFRITLETNDLSEFSSTVTDGGQLSASGASAMVGSFGMQAIIDDTNAMYGQKDFIDLVGTYCGWRFYFDPNGMTITNLNNFLIVRILGNNAAQNYTALQLENNGGQLRVRASQVNDAFGSDDTAYYNITDDAHWFEVRTERASGAVAVDGELKFWIDDVLKETVSNLDIWNLPQPDTARLGPVTGLDIGTSGTPYWDDFILRDDSAFIGENVAGVPPKMMHYARMRNG